MTERYSVVLKWKKGCSALLIFVLMVSITSGSQLAEGGAVKSGTSTKTNETTRAGTVTANPLYVHETYAETSRVIGSLPQGVTAYIMNSYQGWHKITFNNGTGWVYGAYLKNIHAVNSPSSSVPSSSATGSSSSSGSSAPTSSGAASTSRSSATSSKPAAKLPASALPSKITAGYYANWSAHSGFTPDKIKASMINVVHYAFADIDANLKIAVNDPSVDYANFRKLTALKKKHPRLKTLITIGGWDGSARFSDAALTDARRKAFAKSCVAFIKEYGFDGVDIDWEYPVSGGAAGRAADKTNFTLLMRALRSALNAQAATDGKYYYLTFAGGSSDSYTRNVQLSQLASCVDYAVDMTYDMHGPWDTYSDLNAPLYTPTDSSPQYKASVVSSLQAWQNAGFPAKKLVMGLPFYGYLYNGVSAENNGLYSRFTSAKAIGYDSIVSNYLSKGLLSSFYPSEAKVPTLSGGSTFISYDDVSSIALKAQYSASHGLKGVAAWELSYDRNNTLLSAAYNNLH
ncbi:hypothetical protein FL966_00575 [Caproiciproducens galactitolivorans]|nr:hypothetical protein FL966_00575 [Caproiciproducens galactitolivorans]